MLWPQPSPHFPMNSYACDEGHNNQRPRQRALEEASRACTTLPASISALDPTQLQARGVSADDPRSVTDLARHTAHEAAHEAAHHLQDVLKVATHRV